MAGSCPFRRRVTIMMIELMHQGGRLLPVALLLLLGACHDKPERPLPAGAFRLADDRLNESSGLVASMRQSGILWSINDSGSVDRLYRVGPRGEALGRVSIGGAWLRDAESLALWRHAGQDWVLIADVGDNRQWRGSVAIHAVPEPAPSDDSATVAWSIRFRYPDGPRDAEAVAVDVSADDLLVLSKRDEPPRLYRVPLDHLDEPGLRTAEFIGTANIGPDDEVTGMDVASDGRSLAVVSYRRLFLWHREADENWATTMSRPPETRTLPNLGKAEAVAFIGGPHRLAMTAEREPRPLWYHDRPIIAAASFVPPATTAPVRDSAVGAP